MKKRVLIAAGGTGGHIYPAMGVATALLETDPNLDILFTAGGLAESPYFDRQMFSWKTVDSAPFFKKNPLKFLKNCRSIAKGCWESHKILSDYKPNLVIGFGSYHTFPVLSAARLHNYPIVLHEQNSKPGKVIRLFSKRALLTGVYFPNAQEQIFGKTSLLTMPLRKGFQAEAIYRKEAANYFGLEADRLTLLIFGGSQGAQFLNRVIVDHLALLSCKDFQVLHFTGKETDVESVTLAYAKCGINAIVKSSEERMHLAWKLADLAIVRAGAGTIAEQMEFTVPCIFIPYPLAAEGHQQSNAEFVVNQVEGGWCFPETNWNPSAFQGLLEELLLKKSARLLEKQQNLVNYRKSSIREEFTCVIQRLLKQL